MAQSVELLLDEAAESATRRDWAALAEAGLPSEQRARPDSHHRPHITVFAAAGISPETNSHLPAVVAGLDLELQLGALQFFGPHRDRFVLVRSVASSLGLLELQTRVAAACGADPLGQFGAGLWTPHVTLARRVTAGQAGVALRALGSSTAAGLVTHVRQARRWDGAARTAWLL